MNGSSWQMGWYDVAWEEYLDETDDRAVDEGDAQVLVVTGRKVA